MSRILITGGAGYIGSHVVRELVGHGEDVVVVDDLSHGHPEAVQGVELVESDFAASRALEGVLGNGVDFIVHMAAFCEVGESVARPERYYANNVTRTLRLLDAAVRQGVRGIVFSSTAAVYGEPESTPIDETHRCLPTNPYGETKLAIERALSWYARAHGLSYVVLRYFNAAGAHPDGTLGEDHTPETHLVPLLLQATVPGARPIRLFGDDYPTPDGTCVRDYVHVMDLAGAHRLAIEAMRAEGSTQATYNLGNGDGFSVRQVLEAVEGVTGRTVAVEVADRRPGDPATLVASSRRARERLGWTPAHAQLEAIIETARNWYRYHPSGYAGTAREETAQAR